MEAAVVGKPDPERTQVVKAFVVPRSGYQPALAEELQQFVKTRLSGHAYPHEIEFVEHLPRTASGKLQRFVLRPTGDRQGVAIRGAVGAGATAPSDLLSCEIILQNRLSTRRDALRKSTSTLPSVLIPQDTCRLIAVLPYQRTQSRMISARNRQ
jgi:hypothetical protein